jgi:hypothetical protein
VSFLTGLAVGIGATIAARDLAPALAPHVRPLAKHGLKLAVRGFEQGRETMALFAESLSDLLAEVQTELQAQHTTTIGDGGELLAELLANEQPVSAAPEQ